MRLLDVEGTYEKQIRLAFLLLSFYPCSSDIWYRSCIFALLISKSEAI